jgi:hypothetical protein
MIRFPLALFPPSEHLWYPAGAALSGGRPIAGVAQTGDASGGGAWVCEYQVAILRTKQQVGVYRSIIGRLNSGVTLLELPVLDALQPWPGGIHPALTPFADLTDFSDGSEFLTSPIVASLAADAYMTAWPAPPVAPTQAQILLTTCAPLQGVEYFSIIGPSGFVKLHLINEVVLVAGGVTTVNFTPPFREDMAAGTPIDFNYPRCTMKADVASVKAAWPTMRTPFTAQPKIIFAESGFVVPTE